LELIVPNFPKKISQKRTWIIDFHCDILEIGCPLTKTYYNETNYPAGLHQVVLTNDGTSMRFYRDGKFIDVHTNTEVQGGSDVGFSIGRFGIFENIESYFQGEIGNVLLYNRVLLANEIAWLHRNPLAMFELRE